MGHQLGFDLPSVPALGREDFMLAPSNALAMSLIEAWPNWNAGKLVLSGPEGSGKTHLTHVWATKAGARIIAATDLNEDDIPALADAPIAVEDVSAIAGHRKAETALFHLHNLVLANGHSLLFSGVGPVALWPLVLPDLQSRLQGAATAELAPPDDTLLAAVMAKQFADRQITPPANVIDYLLLRIDRSFAAARDVVTRLDQASLAAKKPVTRGLAIKVLGADTQPPAPDVT